MVRILLCCATLAVVFLVSGCAGSTLSEAEQQVAVAAASSPAKLQPGDKIRIVVFGEDNLNGEYQVDQSGQISLPLAGTIKVQGLTQAELEQELANKFRSQYLKSPKVTVTITTLRPYYMMGEVKGNGQDPPLLRYARCGLPGFRLRWQHAQRGRAASRCCRSKLTRKAPAG